VIVGLLRRLWRYAVNVAVEPDQSHILISQMRYSRERQETGKPKAARRTVGIVDCLANAVPVAAKSRSLVAHIAGKTCTLSCLGSKNVVSHLPICKTGQLIHQS
jgi:hypothetical protein